MNEWMYDWIFGWTDERMKFALSAKLQMSGNSFWLPFVSLWFNLKMSRLSFLFWYFFQFSTFFEPFRGKGKKGKRIKTTTALHLDRRLARTRIFFFSFQFFFFFFIGSFQFCLFFFFLVKRREYNHPNIGNSFFHKNSGKRLKCFPQNI